MSRAAGLLRDVGMIAVPDAVVDKRGKLDPETWSALTEQRSYRCHMFAADTTG